MRQFLESIQVAEDGDTRGHSKTKIEKITDEAKFREGMNIDSGSYDLFVSGAGSLGARVAASWKRLHKHAVVVGETMTEKRHALLRSEQIQPATRETRESVLLNSGKTRENSFANVIYCVPPSDFVKEENQECPYVKDVQNVLSLWNRMGSFVFISSGGVYDAHKESSVFTVDVNSKLSNGERAQRLIRAEKACLEAGGTVLRMGGLYDLQRGPHFFWYTKASNGHTLEGNPNHIINLIHYQDAARCAIAALGSKLSRKVFLVSDGSPLTRQEILNESLKIARLMGTQWYNHEPPQFVYKGHCPREGKVYNVQNTIEYLEWAPLFKSFADFCHKTATRNSKS